MSKFDIKYQNYDVVVKDAFSIFNNQTLNFLGLNLPEIECLLSTEFAEITAQETRVDMVFRLKDQTILHIECEVHLSKKDLLRFAAYDLRLYEKYNVPIHTVIFCIGSKKATLSSIDTGVMQYKVSINNLVEMDSDIVLKKLKQQISLGIKINPLELIFLPLMNKSRPIEDILLETMQLEKTWEDFTMYKVFEFAEEKGMERGMKRGMERGMEHGLAKGREEGKAELLLKILTNRLKNIPTKYSEKIYTLSVETIEEMSINAFEIKSLADLDKYLQKK